MSESPFAGLDWQGCIEVLAARIETLEARVLDLEQAAEYADNMERERQESA